MGARKSPHNDTVWLWPTSADVVASPATAAVTTDSAIHVAGAAAATYDACAQVDAKLSDEMLRQEVAEQQTQLQTSLHEQLLGQQRQQDLEQAALKGQLGDVAAGLQALQSQTETKVRTVCMHLRRV